MLGLLFFSRSPPLVLEKVIYVYDKMTVPSSASAWLGDGTFLVSIT